MYTLARPAHSPYGSSSSAVSHAFDRPAAQRPEELHEPEVADEPVVEAAEPLEADDADRPRPEPALAFEPRGDHRCRDAAQPLELERAAQPDERGAARARASRARAAATERAPPRSRGRRRDMEPLRSGRAQRADDLLLEPPRALRLDQLAAERAEERLRDGRARAPAAGRAARWSRGRAADRARSGAGTPSGRRRARASSAAAWPPPRTPRGSRPMPSGDCQARASSDGRRRRRAP